MVETPPLRIGVAGVGEIGLMHAAKIRCARDCELVALASADPSRAARAAGSLAGDVDVVAYDELFSRDDVEAVLVTSRSVDHPAHVASALEAGKHVMVEKPASITAEGRARIRRAHSARPELVLQVGYMRRFDPHFCELRRSVQAGEIGEPLSVELASRELFPPSPDEDPSAKGGLVLDIGIHDFDAAAWLVDDEPTRCYASGSTLRYPELEAKGDLDTAMVVIDFCGGGRAHAHVSRAGAVGLEVSCDVYGTEGSLHLWAARPGAAIARFTSGDRQRFPEDYRQRFGDAFRAELAAFVAACYGEPGALPDLETDARAVELALAARRSLASGRAEPVEQIGA